MRKIFGLFLLLISFAACRTQEQTSADGQSTDSVAYSERHRPQIHFSPEAHWMNDPNGMVFYDGEYHLFYQHFPDDKVWGPMHWGHAISTDLIHWKHFPIALYPDSLGYIFSGCAVVDYENTTGFGTKESPAMVAMFTYHAPEKEKAGASDYQNQGIAYSTDKGRTWTKYERNPVLRNQGVKDFRDPKVFWSETSRKWTLILAVKDHVEIWNSPDLKAWTKLSDFGTDYGDHGGVWECPDLFQLPVDGENISKWVMLVSINPGGPNGGSATQYFVGDFDGKTFKPDADKNFVRWLDFGPDDYAGVTWGNIQDGRKIFLGWMSNWAYAQEVPTTPWRSALTLPRDLKLTRVDGKFYVRSEFSPEVLSIASQAKAFKSVEIMDSLHLDSVDISKAMLSAVFDAKDFSIILSNSKKQQVRITYNATNRAFTFDRSKSGDLTFSKQYFTTATAPRIATSDKMKVTMITDVASVELLFDDGLTVMTGTFFPDDVFTELSIVYKDGGKVEDLSVFSLKSIW